MRADPPMGEFPIETWTTVALVQEVKVLREDLRRKEATIYDLLGKSATGMRVVSAPKKRRGTVDAIGRRQVRESLIDHVLVNILTLCITVPSALAAGELSLFFVFQGLTAACLAPLIKYLQKRSQSFD